MKQQRIAVITGASSGIGAACARLLAEQGVHLILCARRISVLDDLAEELLKAHQTAIHTIALDVRDNDAIKTAFMQLPGDFQNIDILINNAGLALGVETVDKGDPKDWGTVIDTNIKGLLYMTRALLPGMLSRNRGHIINIGSIAGHEVYPKGAVYCATKHAVHALTQGIKMDILGSAVKVTSIDPGMVETEFSVVRNRGNEETAKKVYQGMTPLTPEDIAETLWFILTRPPHVNISDIIILANDQASATLVSRAP